MSLPLYLAAVLSLATGADDFHCECLRHRLEAAERARSRELYFDEATGRDMRNYPPHVLADYEHTRLEFDIPDMNVPRLSAVCTHTLKPLVSELSMLRLRAGPPESMKVRSVSCEGEFQTEATFEHKGEDLRITFVPAIPAGKQARVTIAYDLSDPPEGLTWVPESPDWPGRPAQLHTQGQPESNHYWFPCHDFPNERAAQSVIVKVPAGFVASSNGALAGHSSEGGRDVFSWELQKPHVPYLATLVVGKFDVVRLDSSRAGTPVEVYAPVGKGGQAEQTFGRTASMIDFFESFTGHAYAWPRYAQLVVHNFAAGGMENTSATTLFDTAILDKTALLDGDMDGLISHELAHQWFGDLVTCNSWEDIWLNEGFATYFTHLWFQKRDGDEAYLAALYSTRAGLVENDKSVPLPAPFVPAMCSKEYRQPWDVFRRAANPYPKGAFILHMLRERLGDRVFREGISTHLDRRSLKTAETRELRQAFEDVSGEGLEQFFHQWCYRPGVPRVNIAPAWNGPTGELVFRMKQTQPMDGYNPAFALSIPVEIRTEDSGEWTRFQIEIDGREAEARVKLSGPPTVVAVDPRAAVLADIRVSQPSGRWMAQLREGPTIAARMQAIEALAAGGDAAIGGMKPSAAIAKVARDSRARHELRAAAATGLRKLKARGELLDLAEASIGDARVRNAVMGEVAAAAKEAGADKRRALAVLRDRAERDPSYAVRATSFKALGELGDVEALSMLIAATSSESQHDQIRQAAVDGLAALDRAEGLDAVLAVAAPGHLARTRPAALKAAGRLAKHDQARVFAALTGYLADGEDRTRRGAAEALVVMADERARKPLEELAAKSPSEVERASARQCLRDLDAAIEQAKEKAPAATKPVKSGWVAPVPVNVGGE